MQIPNLIDENTLSLIKQIFPAKDFYFLLMNEISWRICYDLSFYRSAAMAAFIIFFQITHDFEIDRVLSVLN